ncbi:RAD51-associated protein 1-like isoform X1 [Argonauta hians]
MSEKRSSRRNVNYASAFDNEDSGDEDFIQSKAPPSKRLKSNTEEKSKKANSQSSSSGEKIPKPKRKKLDDKVFERELKLAMQISLQEIGSNVKEENPKKKTSDFRDPPKKNSSSERVESLKLSRHDIHSPPKSPSCRPPPLLVNEKTKSTPNNPDDHSAMPSLHRAVVMKGPPDDIEYLGTVSDDEDLKSNVHRRTSGRVTRKKIQLAPESSEDEGGSDFEAEQVQDDDDDDGEDDDDEEDGDEEEEDESDQAVDEHCDYFKKPTKKNKEETKKKTKMKKDSSSENNKSITVKQKKQTVNKSSSKAQTPNKSKVTSLECPSEVTCSNTPDIPKSSNTTRHTKVTTVSVKLQQPTVASLPAPVKRGPVTITPRCNSSSSVSSALPVKQPAWNPPGKSSHSVPPLRISSPPAGIRIGLSRNQKVKSLHPTVKAQH